jgi:hypothetical protein
MGGEDGGQGQRGVVKMTYNKIILLKAFLNHQAPQVHVL